MEDALVDRHPATHREDHDRDHDGPEVQLLAVTERVPGIRPPPTAAEPDQDEGAVAGVHERVDPLGDHRRASRDPGRDELDARDGEVRREGGQRRGRRLGMRSPGAHEAGLLARQGPGARHPPIRSSGRRHVRRVPSGPEDPRCTPRPCAVPTSCRTGATGSDDERRDRRSAKKSPRKPSGSQPSGLATMSSERHFGAPIQAGRSTPSRPGQPRTLCVPAGRTGSQDARRRLESTTRSARVRGRPVVLVAACETANRTSPE